MQSTEEREDRLYRKIETATEGLEEEFRRCFTKMSEDNAGAVADYILSMKYETNLSDNYRRNLIRILSIFSRFCKNKPLKSMIREDFLSFLDNYRKPESVDPMHKWIGTYNVFRTYLVRFFKWSYYPDISPNARPKPAVIENIGRLKRKEISTNQPLADLMSVYELKYAIQYMNLVPAHDLNRAKHIVVTELEEPHPK